MSIFRTEDIAEQLALSSKKLKKIAQDQRIEQMSFQKQCEKHDREVRKLYREKEKESFQKQCEKHDREVRKLYREKEKE